MKIFTLFLTALHLITFTIHSTPLPTAPTQTLKNASKYNFINEIEKAPLILSNHDLEDNSLQDSLLDLLNHAQESILIISFSLTDPEVIRILNQKASSGVEVLLVIDRDHLHFKETLHPSIKIETRNRGEGHLHHKILVVDRQYIWLGSANFTQSCLTNIKNLAIAFYNAEIGAHLHDEAVNITSSHPRAIYNDLSCLFGNQTLELYLLPHNAPEAPHLIETAMNEIGKQKLISLIENAKHSLKISVAVWTYKDASRAVINAMKKGVTVDIEVGSTMDEAVRMLIENGVNVKQGKNLHYKFLLIDHEILLNGSPNWSMNAFSRSDESFIVLYNLSEKQLQSLEGAFKIAGLPLPTF